MRLPSWNDKLEYVCQKCKSKNVKKTNPHIGTILYWPLLLIFKHVNFHCFNCGNDWDDYYFK